jgi:hypothetical protein
MTKLRAFTLTLVAVACISTAQAQGLRPEIGKPLQQAGELLKAGKAKQALDKVREAEAAGPRTAAEQLTVARMKAAAAQRAGDSGTAISAMETIASKVGGAELGQVAEQLAAAYAQQRNNGKAGEWLAKAMAAGNNSATVRQLQSYLRAASGDYAAIGKEAAASIAAAEKAGRRPEEADLLRLADAQQRTNDNAGYSNTLEKLVVYYRKPDYWNGYLARLPRKPGFADRFALDVMRLKLATGSLNKTDEYMEMAQLALQAGLATEGLSIVEQGYKAGVLGTGPEAARHQRLKDLAIKQEAAAKAGIAAEARDAASKKDGNDLVKVGYQYVTQGVVDKGIALIEQGIAKGGLKRAEDAKLRLGMAQMRSPKLKAKATQTLRSVQGKDGVADIARLWIVAGPPAN